MRTLLFSLFAALIPIVSSAQFYTETFETGGLSWLTSGTTSENDWRTSTCAGNGSTLPGTTALYISKGGTQPGCGVDGVDQFAYVDAPLGSDSLIRYKEINGQCYQSMNISFDYLVNGDANDYAEIVVSTDAVNWIVLGPPLFDQTSWTSASLAIPGSFDNTLFYIGVRFVYNDNTIDGVPVAIDNVQISGTDNTAPNALCPSNQSIYTTSSTCDGILPDYTDAVLVTDICNDTNVTITQNAIPGTALSAGTSPHTITMTIADGSGNSSQCQFDVAVIDTFIPTISCPAGPFTEYLDAGCAVSVPDYSGLVTTSDNCESVFSLTVTQAPPAGATIGTNTIITYTATDNYGNSATCNFTLNVVDTISPTVICPGNDTIPTGASCSTIIGDYTSLATPSDNCTFGGSITVTQSPTPGTSLNAGDHTVTLTADDGNGNTGSCTFQLTIEDETAPVISNCGGNQTVYSDANCEGILDDYTSGVITFDNCSATANLTFGQSPAPGITITSSTVVLLTVTDESGNSNSCQLTALLTDTINPVINCPANFSLNIDANCEYLIPDITGNVTGTDNCSLFGDMNVTQNPTAGATGDGITNVTLQLTDEQGNSSTCVTVITPIDTVVPTINCPNPAPVNNGSLCDHSLSYYGSTASVIDNCPNYTITQSPAAGTIVSTGTQNITLTVTDAGGNASSCSFDLDIIENVLPTITCPSDTASCDPIVTYTSPTFADNCGATLLQTDATGYSSGSSFPVGVTTLEYTAVDSSGNMATCSFNVEILPFATPAVIQEDTIGLCGVGSVVLEADTVISGSGLWTISSGSGTFNNPFAHITGVNSVGTGTNVFVWTVSSPNCGSSSDSVIVIRTQEDLQASTQDTIIACNDLSVPLQANTPLYGTGMWSTTSSGIIDNASSANTSASLTDNGWHAFVWTITNPGCPTTADTVEVFSMGKPIIDQNDTSVCLENYTLTLSVGNAADGQEILWYSDNNSIQFSEANNDTTDISGLDNGINYIVCSFDYPGCQITRDTIEIAGSVCNGFDPVIPTVITPGNFDGKNDLFNIDFLDILYPNCHVVIFNRWGSIVYESTGYSSPWDGTYQGAPLPMGTYYYKIELNDENQQILTGDISIIN